MLSKDDLALLRRCPFKQMFRARMAREVEADRDRAVRLWKAGYVRLVPLRKNVVRVVLTSKACDLGLAPTEGRDA